LLLHCRHKSGFSAGCKSSEEEGEVTHRGTESSEPLFVQLLCASTFWPLALSRTYRPMGYPHYPHACTHAHTCVRKHTHARAHTYAHAPCRPMSYSASRSHTQRCTHARSQACMHARAHSHIAQPNCNLLQILSAARRISRLPRSLEKDARCLHNAEIAIVGGERLHHMSELHAGACRLWPNWMIFARIRSLSLPAQTHLFHDPSESRRHV